MDLSEPVKLLPVHIPKPWGQEIWYTGMEARGESQVATAEGALSLSAYLELDRARLLADAPLLLLKVLDPDAGEVVGDLYFEVHEEKQEVYVVTHVDETAWPDGVGKIRFGMNQTRRAQSANDEAFRAEYLAAVKAYEAVRRDIDERVATPAADTLAAEATLRGEMEAFSAMRNLIVGDVVRVPTWTPHSLQHGVRVVEFQTPTYERYIVSFAQKVLTQDHWDTEHAVARMHLETPEPEVFESIAPGIERIARFSDFNVWRAALSDAPLELPGHLPYAVCMCIDGDIAVGAVSLQAEEAALVPAEGIASTLLTGPGRVLIAAPGL